MPSATARRLYEDQIPSFMSVFDLGAETMDDQSTVTVVDPKIIGFPSSSFAEKQLSSLTHPSSASTTGPAAPPPLSDPSHRHHDSTSTQMSESADSSPTTTMSCTDSSSLSDPSPSSSPDSPINLLPLAAFPGPSFGGFASMSTGLASLSVIDPNNGNTTNSNNNNGGQGLERPMTSPSPRRRNMKGLSIQPPFVSPTLPTSTQISEPTSPSFIKPQIPAMKRKPSQLSLKTTTHDLVKSTAIEVPQSPSLAIPPILQRRALKHSTSSPHILSSLNSSTFGPPGGMTFPTVLERNESGLSEFLRPSKPAGPVGLDATILEEESPIRAQIANRAAYEFEPYHEVENNEDQKTPGYPDGPIAIYDDNVFLYLEPTAEEASRFDVVINVAREVKNPFKSNAKQTQAQSNPLPPQQQQQQQQQQHQLSPPRLNEPRNAVPKLAPIMEPAMEQEAEPAAECEQVNGSIPIVTEPTTKRLEASHAATSSRLKRKAPALSLTLAEPSTSATEAGNEDNTPTTPKATQTLQEPEYIHIPWDHNTDIGQDLMMLCEAIDKRTKEGKKVLIHCQQGASRSASLIIAYGMYQNPELTVNDSYYAAQAKSRWISPNMRLMYCLQDFQKEVRKRRGSNSWLRPGRSPTKHRAALSMDAIEISPKEPLSAPLPAEDANGSGSATINSPERSPMRPRGNSTPNSREPISPGPSSAPSSFSWDEKEDESDPQRFGRFDFGFTSTGLQPPKLNAPPLSQAQTFGGSGGLTLPGGGNGTGGGFMRPPPSPGFAAHRFGEFPGSSYSNPSSSGFPLLSPGFPPPRSSCSDGLDSILARNMDPPPLRPINYSNPLKTTATNIARTTTTTNTNTTTTNAPPAPTFKTSFFNLPSIIVKPSPKPEQSITIRPAYVDDDEPLMSPRAETMTNNPLHDQLADHQQYAEMSSAGGMHFVEARPTLVDDMDKEISNELFSPRETMFPRDPFFPFGRPTQVDDPRSPPTKGETPIVRSIDEFI
ncbi:protein-tyrosine phosphatase [Sporothrix brasiliensis 5110]|uniref:protein-tyrosine-phosphatase n=1 Tax=Sporothrix brasiliensis 5110 TaxID=1398154 RepID=A0A0C2EVS0_9PEZI|nr:protein-tyrosine phosphatase [Sporothrix brasiliensis 5110]KIH90629.1 protein-tyrosine phosphatase [Sporothrix brasiliensis 5110]